MSIKLKDLIGKKVIRTRPREWVEEENSAFAFIRNQSIKKQDRSYMCKEMELLEVTEGLAYFRGSYNKDLVHGDSKEDTFVLSLYEFDDGFWEESLIDWLKQPNSIKFMTRDKSNDKTI